MNKATYLSWLMALISENLGPKLGSAYAVAQVASIAVKAGTAADTAMPQAFELVAMLYRPLHGWQVTGFIVVFAAWLVAMCLRGLFAKRKIKSPAWFRFSQQSDLLARLCGFFAGTLAVPFALVWAIMLTLPEPFSAGDFARLSVLSIGLAAVLVTLDWSTFFDAQLPNAIAYVIAAPSGSTPDVETATVDKLTAAVATLPWVGKPKTLAHSDDGHIVLNLPIRYPADKWSNDEAASLMARLLDTESAWAASGCKVLARVIPHNINRKIPLRMRNAASKPHQD